MSPGVSFISYSHSDSDISYTLDSLETIFRKITKEISDENYLKHIEGEIPQTVWTMKIPPTLKKKENLHDAEGTNLSE